MNDDVANAFDAFPERCRPAALKLRALILRAAKAADPIGPVHETLKWGEPAYLPARPRVGSTVRIAWQDAAPDQVRMMFHCQTTLVDDFRTQFPELRYDGNRAIVLEANADWDEAALEACAEAALTYHLRKRRARS